jgi:hypothetical protein
VGDAVAEIGIVGVATSDEQAAADSRAAAASRCDVKAKRIDDLRNV